jgi:hypothetical protein
LLNTVEHFWRLCLLLRRRCISQLEAELSGEMPWPVSKLHFLLSTFRFFFFLFSFFFRERRFLHQIHPSVSNFQYSFHSIHYGHGFQSCFVVIGSSWLMQDMVMCKWWR